MSDTTSRASADGSTPVDEEQPTPLADETARELDTGEPLVQPSPDPADQTDTAQVAPLPEDYRPVSASEHVAPGSAVPTASTAPAADAAPPAPAADSAPSEPTAREADAASAALAETSADGQPGHLPADPTDPAQHSDAVAAAAASADADSADEKAADTQSAAPESAGTQSAAPATTSYAGPTYLNTPTPPKKKSNRGLGILIAVLGVVVFAAANLAATLGILTARYSVSQAKTDILSYVQGWEFWVPVAVFAAAFIALVAIVNRGRWWAYLLGSIFVAALVFAAYFGAALLTNRIWERTPGQARTFAGAYFQTNIPYLWVAVAATFIALEVVTWLGGWIAFHGQKAKRRYAEAKAAYDAEYAADR